MYRLQRDKNINVFFYTAVSLGLVSSLMHLVKYLFVLVLSIAFYRKANLSSISFVAARLIMIYIPLLLISPNIKIPKAFILRKIFLIVSVLYLLGCSWPIFYMIEKGSFLALFTDDINYIADFQYNSAMMFNYMTWICFSPLNVVFSLIQAFLFYVMAESIVSYKAVFSITALVSTIFSIVIPVAFILFRFEPLISLFSGRLLGYFYDNLFFFGTQICTTAALIAISKSSTLWDKYLWTHSQQQ